MFVSRHGTPSRFHYFNLNCLKSLITGIFDVYFVVWSLFLPLIGAIIWAVHRQLTYFFDDDYNNVRTSFNHQQIEKMIHLQLCGGR